MEKSSQIQDIMNLKQVNVKKSIHKHIAIKLLKTKNKDKILKSARERDALLSKEQ